MKGSEISLPQTFKPTQTNSTKPQKPYFRPAIDDTKPALQDPEVAMSGVINKFFITSMFMWMAPLSILYAFNNDLLPGVTHLSPYSLTLFTGFLAVISVNIAIAFYIYMAMKEPSDKHESDPKFLSEAKASVSQLTGKPEDSSQALKKDE